MRSHTQGDSFILFRLDKKLYLNTKSYHQQNTAYSMTDPVQQKPNTEG